MNGAPGPTPRRDRGPRLPPRAVLGGLLKLEGGARKGVPGQRPGGRGVH